MENATTHRLRTRKGSLYLAHKCLEYCPPECGTALDRRFPVTVEVNPTGPGQLTLIQGELRETWYLPYFEAWLKPVQTSNWK